MTCKKNGRQPQKKKKKEDHLKKRVEDDLQKNLFSIPLKFRGKPFLGLAQLCKNLYYIMGSFEDNLFVRLSLLILTYPYLIFGISCYFGLWAHSGVISWMQSSNIFHEIFYHMNVFWEYRSHPNDNRYLITWDRSQIFGFFGTRPIPLLLNNLMDEIIYFWLIF
jgi:hypothetical protein